MSGRFALSRRAAMVEKMAADLVRLEAYAIERDAIRALSTIGGYARQAAFQGIVAKEMAKP